MCLVRQWLDHQLFVEHFTFRVVPLQRERPAGEQAAGHVTRAQGIFRLGVINEGFTVDRDGDAFAPDGNVLCEPVVVARRGLAD